MKHKILLLIFLLISLLNSGFQQVNNHPATQKSQNSIVSVKLSFVGDIMCHTPQIEYAKIGRDSFDFRSTFMEVKKYLTSSDLTFGNFETVTAGKSQKFSGYPLFNSPDELLDALKDAGFDILFTSNNHSLDRGVDGIVRTIQQIQNRNLINSGTYSTEPKRDSLLLVERNGLKLGIQSYTYGLNGKLLPKNKNYLVNVIDTNLIKKDLTEFHRKNVDLILVYLHFGEEYSRIPSKYQEEIVSKTFKYGADIVIGSHPHVIQTARFIEKGNGKLSKGFVAYSLGNFISNQRWRYSDAGLILNLEIKKDIIKNTIWIENFSVIPTWVFKGIVNGKNQYAILPSDTTFLKSFPDYLSKSDKQKLIESYNDTMEILFKK